MGTCVQAVVPRKRQVRNCLFGMTCRGVTLPYRELLCEQKKKTRPLLPLPPLLPHSPLLPCLLVEATRKLIKDVLFCTIFYSSSIQICIYTVGIELALV